MTLIPLQLQVILAALVLIAAFTDIRSRTIPNWLVLGGLAVGFAVNPFLFGLAGLRIAGLGFLFATGVYLCFYLLHAMGGGDLKLMAAVGSIVGAQNWFSIFILTSIIGGVVALGMLLVRGGFGRTLSNIWHILKEFAHLRAPHATREEVDIDSSKARSMPHGVAICLGTLVYLWASRYPG
jgi:prepilin peptidase CpaA